jgi:mono/diheme cytochrome c family protein
MKRASAAALLLVATAATAGNGPDKRLGERIYRDGLNARGEPVRSLVGLPPSPLNGAPAACGACHALPVDGVVPPENAAPDLRWSALAIASGARASAMTYTEQAFGRAVNEGFDPSGSPISTAMPRYSLSRSEMAALVAFLKSISTAKSKSK